MSREFVLVPKLKYESMMKSVDSKTEQHSQSHQKGEGKVENDSNVSNDQDIKDKKSETNFFDQGIPPKTPTKLYVKRPLSEMDFFLKSEKPREKRRKITKKVKWVNYTI